MDLPHNVGFSPGILSNEMHQNSAHASDTPVKTAVTSMPRARARVFSLQGGSIIKLCRMKIGPEMAGLVIFPRKQRVRGRGW